MLKLFLNKPTNIFGQVSSLSFIKGFSWRGCPTFYNGKEDS